MKKYIIKSNILSNTYPISTHSILTSIVSNIVAKNTWILLSFNESLTDKFHLMKNTTKVIKNYTDK